MAGSFLGLVVVMASLAVAGKQGNEQASTEENTGECEGNLGARLGDVVVVPVLQQPRLLEGQGHSSPESSTMRK